MNLRVDRQVGVTSMESAKSLMPDTAYRGNLRLHVYLPFNHRHAKES